MARCPFEEAFEIDIDDIDIDKLWAEVIEERDRKEKEATCGK